MIFGLFTALGQASGQGYAWQWSDAITGLDDQVITDVASDPLDGSVYVVGYTQGAIQITSLLSSILSSQQLFVFKYDRKGTRLWGFTAGGLGDSQANGVTLDPAGNVYVTGWTSGTVDVGGYGHIIPNTITAVGQKDILLLSYSTNGVLRWARKEGGSSNDAGYRIVADAHGVTMLGQVHGNTTVGNGSINSTAQTNSDILVASRYTFTGGPRWVRYAENTGGCLPRSIASNGSVIYIAFQASSPTVTWKNGSNSVVGSYTASGTNDLHLTSMDSLGTMAWTVSVASSSNSASRSASVAAKDQFLYLGCTTSSGAVLPGGTTVPAGSNDQVLLTRLSPANGSTLWFRSANTTAGGHDLTLTDLAIGRNGTLHALGQFKTNLSIGSRNVSAPTSKITGFLATIGRYGVVGPLTNATSSQDLTVSCVAADDLGFIPLAGIFKDDASAGDQSLTGSNDLDGSLFDTQAPSVSGADVSIWGSPPALCANDGPLDLTTTLYPYTTGSGQSVTSSSNVVNATGALGQVLGSYAVFNQNISYVVIDMGSTIPAGAALDVLWRVPSGSSGLTLYGSLDGTNFTLLGNLTTSATTFTYSSLALPASSRYIKLARSGVDIVHVDGIFFTYESSTSGTWSGDGVVGTTFDPSTTIGASPYAVTYTVTDGADVFSTTHSITVSPVPVAGTLSASPTVCPWSDATVYLNGHVSTSLRWGVNWNGAGFMLVPGSDTVLVVPEVNGSIQVRAFVSNPGCTPVPTNVITVDALDNTAPQITSCAQADTLFVDGTCHAIVPDLTAAVMATDDCPGTLFFQQAPIAGSSVGTGTTSVAITVSDSTGNATTCSVDLLVRDTIPPVIGNCPGDTILYVPATSCTAPFQAPLLVVSDNCGFF
ncbi:MAG: SBBP repeat-containing protein, partial [Flavobacteriales bacterium]|nr:SBBP repeat-containing protein [Flavobacteriales bacterium]